MENFFTQETALTAEADTAAARAQQENTAEHSALLDTGDAGQPSEDGDLDDGSTWFAGEDEGDTPGQDELTDSSADGETKGDTAADTQAEGQDEAGKKTDADDAKRDEKKNEEKPTPDEAMTLKYYGREVRVPMDEARTLAQKGMDYDKVRAERDALAGGETGQALELLQTFAAQAGMTLPQYLQTARAQMELGKQESAVQAAKDMGMDENAAREYVRMQHQVAEMQRATQMGQRLPTMAQTQFVPPPEQVKAMQAQAHAQEEHNRLVAQMGELLAVHPGLTELPEPVLKSMDSGMAPLAAYTLYENEQLKAQLRRQQQAERNKAAPGSVSGYAANEAIDPFTAGFLSGE